MIFIADSGSTKTQWRFLSPEGSISQAKTAGYNPHHQKALQIQENLQQELLPQLNPPGLQPKKIYFYGAGCSSEKSKSIVRMAFGEVFPEAEVVVEHDLLAAARALCGDEPGIACILGTGSNSCLYNGQQITHNIPALGWILGDEGSGTDLGRRVVSDYLRSNMPEHLSKAFTDTYGKLEAEDVNDRIYRQPFPKPYIASFARFLNTHLQDPWCYRHVYDSFRSFLEKNVCKYPDYQQYKLHFVGSVAYYNNNVLQKAANDLGLRVHHVLESPIAGLTLYHQKVQ